MPCYHCAGWRWWCNGVGMWWNKSFMPWMCIPQISISTEIAISTARCYYPYGPTFLKNVELMNQCHIELRQF